MTMKPVDTSESSSFGVTSKSKLAFSGTKSPHINGKLVKRQNPFSLTKEEGRYGEYGIVGPFGNFVVKSTTSVMDSTMSFGSYQSFDESLLDQATLDAYSDLYQKVANVADLIRTRQETASMVVNRLRSMVSLARDLRHGRIEQASKRLGRSLHPNPKTRSGQPLGARWLEYSYGWSPLVQDVYNILDKGFGPIMFRSSGFASNDLFDTKTKTFGTPSSFYGMETHEVGVTSLQSAKCFLFAEVPGSAVSAISAWGLDNPALLAWEALPYSFVVDWFLPVGDYLNVVGNVGYTAKVTGALRVQTLETTMSGKLSIDREAPYKPYGSGAPYYRYYRRKNRLISIPSVPLPRFKNPFSLSQRVLNQLGLLNVELRKRISR
ncbi:MAG: maturation protein [Sanya levivirus 1]|uniref:Maturation protein n=1 Tax=Sanya levivirus 1 TaxID=2905509 RepID=A0A8K1XHC3_9VIRU|nr:MAG: maturation protein [Sanya levivirus 1]